MGRVVGRVLIGVGVLLLALAPLLRFYAYPRLAVVPIAQKSTSVSKGSGLSVFYVSDLQVKDGVNITYTRTVHGDVNATKEQIAAGHNTAVWDTFSYGADDDGNVLSSSLDRVAFDRTTAQGGLSCCNQYTAPSEDPKDREQTNHPGLFFKMPFNAQKTTYRFWDGTTKKAEPAQYTRTETLDGVTTYVYVQHIGPVTVDTEDVPAALVGASGSGDVSVDRVYQNTRTLWIEPNTGAIIKGQEQQDVRFERDGARALTLLKGTIGYDDATIKANADEYGGKGTQIHLVRSILPLTFLVLGVILLFAGIVLLAGAGRRSPGPGERRAEPRSPRPATTQA